MIERLFYLVVGGALGAAVLFGEMKFVRWRERHHARRAKVDSLSCGQCGGRPDKEDRKRIAKEEQLPMAVGWLCARCAPELDLATSGLTFRVIDVDGESPWV